MSLLRSISFNGVPFDKLIQQPQQLPLDSFRNMTNIQCHQDMRQYIPATAQYIFNYIVGKASNNRFRAIHYNMLVADNFSNPELIIITTFVINLAYMKAKQGVFNNIEQAIVQTANWVTDRRISFVTISNNDLASAAPNNIGDIRNSAVEYITEAENVEQFLSNTYMGSVSAGVGFNNNNQNGFGNSSGGGGFGGSAISGFGNSNTTTLGFGGSAISGFGASSNSNSISSVITRVDSAGVPHKNDNSFSGDLHLGMEAPVEKKITPAPAAVEQEQRVQQEQPVQQNCYNEDGTVNWKALPVSSKPWRTSDQQRYAIAYDSRKYALVNKELPIKGTNKIAVISTLKGIEMERSAHTLPSSELFLNRVVPETFGKGEEGRTKYIDASFNHVSETIKEVRSLDRSEYTKHLDKFRTVGHVVLKTPVPSLEQAISYARQAALTYGSGEYGVYSLEFEFSKELTVKKEDVPAVLNLTKYTTIQSLISKIRGTIEDEQVSQSLRTVMVQINAHLAKRFLDFVRFYLCVDDYSNSDSFIDDALIMIDDIGDLYGKPYKDLIIETQERFLRTNLNFGDPIVSAFDSISLSDDIVEEVNDTTVVLPLTTTSMVVCTEFLDSEYSIQLPKNISGMFTDTTLSKGLYQMVVNLISKPVSTGLLSTVRRFFIVTLDDRIYEVNIGLSDKSAPLLIKRVN